MNGGRATTFNRDAQCRDSSLTDPTGQTFGNYAYTDGLLSELTDRAGNKVKFGCDAERDLPTSVTDGRGNTWKLEYDPDSSRITKLTEPTRDGTGASTTYADHAVDTTKVTDPNLHSSVHEFELPGRQKKATDALGHEQSCTWTPNSDVNVTRLDTEGVSRSVTGICWNNAEVAGSDTVRGIIAHYNASSPLGRMAEPRVWPR